MTITKKNFALSALTVVFLCLSACQPAPPAIFPEGEDMPGLASTIFLEEETTLVSLSDYFREESLPQIDSVSGPELLDFHLSETSKKLKINILSPAIPKVSVAKVWINGIAYALLLENRPLDAHTITFDPQGETYQTVALQGDMNNWDATANLMEPVNGLWEARLYLAPGRYQYLIEANGEKMTDPDSPRQFDNPVTGKTSLLYAGEEDPGRKPFLFPERTGTHSITIAKEKDLEELFVLWENFRLPRENVSRHGDHFHIHIPGDAFQKSSSALRLKGYNLHGSSNLLFIPLENGIPVSYKDWQTSE